MSKVCHASNMTQDLVKATYMPIASCNYKFFSESRCFNNPLLYWSTEIEYHLET